tara:strand:+ start:771 stop:1550 length:780 start_codon:yes stop_codon:yes gene_type:complete
MRFKFIHIVQLQNGALNIRLKETLKLNYIDSFLSISQYQSSFALDNFAKRAFIVGSLSTEHWIKNNKIATDINGFKYDICYICNTFFKEDIKYALELILKHLLNNKDLRIIMAAKNKTNFDEIYTYCLRKFNLDIFNNKNIFIEKEYTDHSTLQSALKSKIIIGSRSTSIYQLGSLGMVVYPIDISKPYGSLSGDLAQLDININPSQKLFSKTIDILLSKRGRDEYFDSNFEVLSKLDATLRLNKYPSENIIDYLNSII